MGIDGPPMAACRALLAWSVLAALVVGPAAAARPARGLPTAPPGPPGRLLQSEDCVDVPNCVACRKVPALSGGNATTTCTKCETGYTSRPSAGRACWCAAGYYQSAQDVCSPCGTGYFCPGARTIGAEGATRTQCGMYKTTRTDKASSDGGCGAGRGG